MSTAINPPDRDQTTSVPDRGTDGRAVPASSPQPTTGEPTTREPTTREPSTREPTTGEVVQAQKERFGGMKFGSCFFGWLAATGTAVLLTALLAAAGTAFGLSKNVTAGQVSAQAGGNAQTVGVVGAIVLLVIVLISYLAGGYVAGRMARFNGLRQGLGVWLWAIIAAVVVAILTVVAGSKFNVLANLNGFPRIPVDEGTLTTTGIITAVVVAVAALVGALLGGLAGMAFHRRVDKADLNITTNR